MIFFTNEAMNKCVICHCHVILTGQSIYGIIFMTQGHL